jgi:hypothetical protein
MSFTVCHPLVWKLICIYFEYAKIRDAREWKKKVRRRWRRHNEITRKSFFLSFASYLSLSHSLSIENEPPSPFISLHLTPFQTRWRHKKSFFSTFYFCTFSLASFTIAIIIGVCYAKKKYKKEKFMIQL